ncbi:hypothetical protein L9W92_18520 [Pelotomaculum terephthalicicum JT]|uniref:hypothetical protein n=1 Tax=Pelotomaculum terephthalicicum TaxID=206393 RepID=UPI001F03ABDF|nr:hypothetical protein [Pelotomaculum terephthalicicum]MCG9969985.1 hypothetical protein [Pelotomaculum terephthalicicum JT]
MGEKMFIEIEYNKIKQNTVNNFAQHNIKTFSSKKTGNIDIKSIENIIYNNINIQISLAYQYYFQREFDSQVVSSIILDKNMLIEEAINNLTTIFTRVVVPYDRNGTPYIIQLKGINEFAKELFKNMILSGKVNPILYYFSLEKSYLNDCNKTAFYEYIDSSELIKRNDYNFFRNNEYVKYILLNKKTFTSSSLINVSGFSIDELNKSLYVNYLYSLVNNLYLFIIKYEFNGRLYYLKQLRWH